MVNGLFSLLARYVRPIETYAYSLLGLTAGSGFGVDSMSVSTSAAVAGVAALIHLLKEIIDDAKAGNWTKVKAEVSTAVADVEAAAAALNQTPGA